METGPPSIDEFTGLQLAGIESYDILALNFFAARGLPGTENSNLEHWLAKRDAWANYAQLMIRRYLPRFDPHSTEQPTPATYGNSLARFFCWYMLRALSDCGIQYHPDRRDAPDTAETPDIFVHGLMDDGGKGGTCASLPVVFVSVGRRIGLPLYLVATRKHLFFRYDDRHGTNIHWTNPELTLRIPPDRFNVSATGEGLSFDDDDFYRRWPLPWRDLEWRNPHSLRSKSRKEELAEFLMFRGECFWELGQWDETMKAYFYARQLVPDNEFYNVIHANTSRLFLEQQAIKQEMIAEINEMNRRALSSGFGASSPSGREHGPNCQCFHCKQADQTPVRMNGHSPYCQCAGCRAPSPHLPAGSPLVNGMSQRNTRGLPSP